MMLFHWFLRQPHCWGILGCCERNALDFKLASSQASFGKHLAAPGGNLLPSPDAGRHKL